MSLTARLRQCLCKEKKPRFCEERVSELGCVMEHSENPATVLAAEMLSRSSPVPFQAAPLPFYRYNRRKRQLIVLKTSEQILGRRHSQLVNIANYLQLRMYPDNSDTNLQDHRISREVLVVNTQLSFAALPARAPNSRRRQLLLACKQGELMPGQRVLVILPVLSACSESW